MNVPYQPKSVLKAWVAELLETLKAVREKYPETKHLVDSVIAKHDR
jgi:hypothetical protein